MKLSTRGEYGLRAIFDLAQNARDGAAISLKSVAERQGISEPYLEQLIASLRKAGLVKSIRGAQGGYLLAKDPKEITVGDVIRVLEGPIAPMDCVNEEDPGLCVRSDHCITRSIWERVRDSVTQVLDSITLEDMCEDARKARQKGDYYMFYI